MRILITGVTGFVGGYLVEALWQRGERDIVGTSRSRQWRPEWYHLTQCAELRSCDLCDGPALLELLDDVRPDQIYHLAGYANAGKSFEEPDAAWAGNLTATRTLYETVHRWGGQPRILFVGSGLIYGDPPQSGQPLGEDCLLRPVNPYAASKAAADLVSYQYARFPGLNIIRARPFNHIGPRQAPHYAVAHFARQIAAIGLQQQPALLDTGNLSAQRDLTDVRDVVEAYIQLMENGLTGDAYNVASGETHAMQDIVDRLLRLAGVTVQIRQQPRLVRMAENLSVCGDARKLHDLTGWTRRYTLDQTLANTLDYWRAQALREVA